jgi:hypothetical protein
LAANDGRYTSQQLVRKNRWVIVRQRVSSGHDAGNPVSVQLADDTMRKDALISLEKNNITWNELG